MKNTSYDNFFTNFANKTKLNIITCLFEEQLCVNEIAKRINEEQSNVSHHLSNLTKCKILSVKKIGKQRIHSLNKETVLPIFKLVKSHIDKNCYVGSINDCQDCLNKSEDCIGSR